MEIIKQPTVAFIGIGSLSILKDSSNQNLENVVRTELFYIIEDLYKEGITSFLLRLGNEFEMLAAEVIQDYAQKHKDVSLFVVLLYEKQKDYCDYDLKRYEQIFKSIKNYGYISEKRLNDYILENCSEVIVYGNGEDPDTKHLLDMAKRRGSEVWNMYDLLYDYQCNQCKIKELLQDYPNVSSFKYSREGIIFQGYNQPYPVEFTQIYKVKKENDMLCFTLKDGMVIKASLVSDDCYVKVKDA